MLNGEELLATWLRPTVVKVTKTNTLSTTDAQRAEDNATGGGFYYYNGTRFLL